MVICSLESKLASVQAENTGLKSLVAHAMQGLGAGIAQAIQGLEAGVAQPAVGTVCIFKDWDGRPTHGTRNDKVDERPKVSIYTTCGDVVWLAADAEPQEVVSPPRNYGKKQQQKDLHEDLSLVKSDPESLHIREQTGHAAKKRKLEL